MEMKNIPPTIEYIIFYHSCERGIFNNGLSGSYKVFIDKISQTSFVSEIKNKWA